MDSTRNWGQNARKNGPKNIKDPSSTACSAGNGQAGLPGSAAPVTAGPPTAKTLGRPKSGYSGKV